jgi:hypothetical protein
MRGLSRRRWCGWIEDGRPRFAISGADPCRLWMRVAVLVPRSGADPRRLWTRVAVLVPRAAASDGAWRVQRPSAHARCPKRHGSAQLGG